MRVERRELEGSTWLEQHPRWALSFLTLGVVACCAMAANFDEGRPMAHQVPRSMLVGQYKPSVGRVVHYTRTAGEAPWAAIVTVVHTADGDVDLKLFPPPGSIGATDETRVPYDPDLGPRSWSWPPRG